MAYKNVPITGVIFAPLLEELSVARKGHGCTLNGRPVKASATKDISKAYIVGCPGGDKNNRRFAMMSYALNDSIKDFRKMGSAAIEAYNVAAGRVDAFCTLNIFPWDIAAGAVIVEESGGRVSDFNGEPWDLTQSDVCMSNDILHEDVLSLVQHVNPDSSQFTKALVVQAD